MTNKNRQRVEQLQTEMLESVKSFMNINGFTQIEFKNSIKIMMEEYDMSNDLIVYPVSVKFLYDDGTLATDDDEILLKSLTIHELSYILDVLEGYEFIVVEEVIENQ